MNTRSYFYVAIAFAVVVLTAGLMTTSKAEQRRYYDAQKVTVETRDAGLLGQGGLLGTGLGANRNASYQRRVPYYKNPNVVEGTSNVVNGTLDTAGAVLPWNWGRENRTPYQNRQYRSQQARESMRNNQ